MKKKIKKIYIIIARKIKDGNGQVLNMKSNDSPQPTPETLLDGITAINSMLKTRKKSIAQTKNSEKSKISLTVKVNGMKL